MSDVGKNIREIRIQKKLSQEQLANQLYVTRQTISSWENGKSEPSFDMLHKVADALTVNEDVLITGKVSHEDNNQCNEQHLPINWKKEWIWIAFFCIMAIALYLFYRWGLERGKYHFEMCPLMLSQVCTLPVYFFAIGWYLTRLIRKSTTIVGANHPQKDENKSKFKMPVLVLYCLLWVLLAAYVILISPMVIGILRDEVRYYILSLHQEITHWEVDYGTGIYWWDMASWNLYMFMLDKFWLFAVYGAILSALSGRFFKMSTK